MKAVQVTERGGPGVLHLVELPGPEPGPGEVLLTVEAAAGAHRLMEAGAATGEVVMQP